MLRLTIKNLLEKKIRFALTSLAVVLGVTFVVSVFTMTDSLRASFEGLASDIASGSELTVRSTQTIGEEIDRAAVPAELDDLISDVDGVRATVPGVAAFNTVITDGDGDAIIPQGPPAIGFSWSPFQFFITEGHEPTAPGQFATDVTTAADNGLTIGESYPIASAIEQREFELVGIFNFGSPEEHRSLGQTMAAFEMSEAQRFLGLEGLYSSIAIQLDSGAELEAVQAAVQAVIGGEYEVVTNEVIEDETNDQFGEAISIFNTILLTFAFIIVFVSAFIINNTFQIVVAQRIRELGLLRAVGASGAQVRNSVLFEALLVGVFSTSVGIVLGLLGGDVLRAILNAGPFSLPAGSFELAPRTLVAAIFVGVGITMLSSIIPARRARKISPIAAIQNDQRLAGASLTRRLVVGGSTTALGAVWFGLGLFAASGTANVLSLLGLGAIKIFIGVYILSPAFARPVATAVGMPIAKLLGTPGQIAQGNAARSPRRTASTAGALMIGLALVGMAGVVGESLTQTFRATFDNAVKTDYFITSPNNFDPTAGFSQAVVDEVAALDEFEEVAVWRFGLQVMQVEGSNKDIVSTDFELVDAHVDAGVVSGSFADGADRPAVAIHVDVAEDEGLAVGDTVAALFPDDEIEPLTLVAIYDNSTVMNGSWTIENAVWERHLTRQDVGWATANIVGFSNNLSETEQEEIQAAAAAALEPIDEEFSSADVESQVEFRQGAEDQLGQFLLVITILLALSLVIALVGIANTLALSVYERTREIGLLRAVGMSRQQLRRAIRWEAVIVSVFGAILGIVLGTIFGVAAVIAVPDTFIDTVAIPWISIVVYVIVAALAGVLAAILPARRAARMNVLDAISHE